MYRIMTLYSLNFTQCYMSIVSPLGWKKTQIVFFICVWLLRLVDYFINLLLIDANTENDKRCVSLFNEKMNLNTEVTNLFWAYNGK